jgi:hypothetical protein
MSLILKSILFSTYLGILFPSNLDEELRKNISNSVIKLREDSRLRTLTKEYYINTKGKTTGDSENQLEFKKLAGLWIILGVGIGIVVIGHLIYKYLCKMPPMENLSPYIYPDVVFENTQICHSIEFEFSSTFL